MPFNRFLLEQVAGDLLAYESNAERARLLIATGFLALGPKKLDSVDQRQFQADVIDEQIDTVTKQSSPIQSLAHAAMTINSILSQ